MNRNSILKLVGYNDNILLTYDAAKKVDEIFNDGSISNDFVIHLKYPAMSFKKSAIKIIEINTANNYKKREEERSKFYEDEKNNFEFNQKKSLKDKAKDTTIFSILYKIVYDTYPTIEMLDQQIKDQENFFASNPQRTICDFYVYKKQIDSKRNNNKKINIFKTGFFRLLEKAIVRDIQLSTPVDN